MLAGARAQVQGLSGVGGGDVKCAGGARRVSIEKGVGEGEMRFRLPLNQGLICLT